MKSIISAMLLLVLVGCGNESQQLSGSNMSHQFLPVEKAFQFSSQQLDDSTVKLSWVIAEGYFLYKNKFEFKLEPDTARIVDVQMPAGVMLNDKTFGRQESYKTQVDILLKLKPEQDAAVLKLLTKYQGCSEKGLCYPPEKREVEIAF